MLKRFGRWIVNVDEILNVAVMPQVVVGGFSARVHFRGDYWADISKEAYEPLVAWVDEQNTQHSYLVSQDGRMTWEWVKHNG